VKIELLYFAGCPNEEPVRHRLVRCLEQAGIRAPILERDGKHPSPTILVNGVDVMGESPSAGRACRLDIPTEQRILDALAAAARDRR
jgi:hypothetical protein